MGLLDALKAATADVQSEPKTNTNGTKKAAAKTNTNSTNKTNKPAAKATTKPKNFLHLFNDYLRSELKKALDERAAGDEVLAKKMQAKGKSFEGCMNYIGEHFYQLALKQRNGKNCVSFGGYGEELVNLAVHYYDEPNEALKEELKAK